MSRWDYDTVFYRVFCVTLLAVAFTFTVILTNVFVDIDGLLSDKDKGKTKPAPAPIQNDISDVMEASLLAQRNLPELQSDASEDVYDDTDYQDSTDLYRSKRSLESPAVISRINDQTVKKILTNHLATLLDELDEEEPQTESKNQDPSTDTKSKKRKIFTYKYLNSVENNKQNVKHNEQQLNMLKDKKKIEKEDVKAKEHFKRIERYNEHFLRQKDDSEQDKELLHLAMHNVILEGIIGNMNLDEVYSKVADLVKNFENNHSMVLRKEEFKNLFKDAKHFQNPKHDLGDETLFEELFNHLDTGSFTRSLGMNRLTNIENIAIDPVTTTKSKGHNVMIKTIIDITSLANDKTTKENDLNSKDILNGVIKLIYNGKSIKFKRVEDDYTTINPNISNNSSSKVTENFEKVAKIHRESNGNLQASYFKNIINNYLKKITKDSESSEHEKLFSRKRLKRHIKIRYDHDKITEKPKAKKEDDELFVEIETHFDSKGTKGEKKKKLIRDLISKIKTAIHSDNASKKTKQKHWHVQKRTQDPLSSRSAATFLNKLVLPFETLAHRHIHPISKAVAAHEDMPLVSDDWGHNHWRKKYIGPRFFTKSINSAEMNTVDVDYNKVMRFNGIPQRLQKPINTDMSEETLQESNVVDLGNMKFIMKDIDGSGFTIGFNQYTDEAPDPDTMKLFSGIENIIKTYHQKYDQEPVPDTLQQNSNDDNENNNPNHGNENQEYQQIDKQDKHFIKRRSIKVLNEVDHLSNEYKAIYKRNFLPFNKYQEIYESSKGHPLKSKSTKRHRMKKTDRSSLILDENVFKKKLKPAEILSIADLFQRRKRSVSVKKMSNVNIKNKINRYLNTKSMAARRMFFNKKRNKRQVDKIRFVARDLLNSHKDLGEDILVVSDEKVFADRAILRELEVPEIEPNEKLHSTEHYDIISPQKEDAYGVITDTEKDFEDHYDIVSPYVYDPSRFETQNNEFTRRARHNSLMSKYPHIIMEETSRSKEEVFPEDQYAFENYIDNIPVKVHKTENSEDAVLLPTLDVHSNNDQEIAGLITSPKDKSNYKVTVKVRPKNSTGMAGFKEIHTSINKSYNKNGLIYTSLVNVSELSKVEKANKNISTRRGELDHHIISNLNQQQQFMKSLIQQHKHRIDEQLRQLHIEKDKLESMNIDNIESLPNAFIAANLSLDSKKSIHLTEQQVSNSFKYAQITTTEASTTVAEIIVTEPATVTTTEYVQPTTEESDKLQIIHTIEKNENMTNEILKKIDQNTSVLKIFLGKLLDKIDASPIKENAEETTVNPGLNLREGVVETANEFNQTSNDINKIKHPIIHNMPFFDDYHPIVPNIFFNNIQRQRNNNTIGIPFVYAIQKPYSMTNNETPVASMVYHGHIHANIDDKRADNTKSELERLANSVAGGKRDNRHILNTQKPATIEKKDIEKEFWKANPGEKVLHSFVRQNNSRFFIDELESDYKVLPLIKKDYKSLGTTGNVTSV